MRSRRYRARRNKQDAELSITAFMNLMVILVPFLLITAVFSKISILELDLPAKSDVVKNNTKSLELEIVVRENSLRVQDRNKGVLKSIKNGKQGYELTVLNEYLQGLKSKYQDINNATILLEPDISYDMLVQIMDSVRTAEVEKDGETVFADLFPDIAVGDAPVYTAGR
ncbi:MAG: biopolymer transporter ExbD [Gammaproteobacteria bacterium]|nr:biopolymer transporter ExbD [Gammaproteobacteria bacterium]